MVDKIATFFDSADMQEVIKFSSNYPKLHNQKTAVLLAVKEIKITETTPMETLSYDATKPDGSLFPITPGIYLQLIFLGNEFRIPFSTIRKDYGTEYKGFPCKRDYYNHNIGQTFQICIIPEDQDSATY